MKKKTLKFSKSRAVSPKADMINSSAVLPMEVMMDIFLLLPTKTLCKLKCVAKQWRSLISDPFFKSLYRARSSLKPSLLFLQRTHYYGTSATTVSMSSFDLNGNHNFDFTFPLDGYVTFMPSKWELICFLSNDDAIYVCNPSTRELVKLPNNPTNSCTCLDGIAFGYIKERNEYVLINSRFIKNNTVCEVMRWTDGCCLKNHSWKVVDAKCPYRLRRCGVLVENTFYWILYGAKYQSIEAINLFDLEKEDFGAVMPPKDIFDDDGHWSLTELKEMLWLFGSPKHISTMYIWLLKDSKNYVWVKEYNIDLAGFNLGLVFINILGHKEGKILLDVTHDQSLEWYDMDKKSFKRIDNVRSVKWDWSILYTDGLFSLGSR